MASLFSMSFVLFNLLSMEIISLYFLLRRVHHILNFFKENVVYNKIMGSLTNIRKKKNYWATASKFISIKLLIQATTELVVVAPPYIALTDRNLTCIKYMQKSRE
jgi:hypothetical protein